MHSDLVFAYAVYFVGFVVAFPCFLLAVSPKDDPWSRRIGLSLLGAAIWPLLVMVAIAR